MIDPNRTQKQLLAEINVSENVRVTCMHDPTDPRFVALDEVCLMIQGKTPEELLPVLNTAFSKRCADLPVTQLSRDLLYPLKKGIGNAYKWGNRRDLTKQITVEAVITKTGILVAISDQGEGFDVNGTLRQFYRGERHYTHGGSGFRQFTKTASLISYANEGRTLLLRFLYAARPVYAMTIAPKPALGTPVDAAFMKSFFSTELPYFQNTKAALHACCIEAPAKPTDRPEVKYTLTYRTDESTHVHRMCLTGRVLTQDAAQIDFSVASQLSQGSFRGKEGIGIPKPMAVLQQPPLVLFQVNPLINLKGYIKKQDALQDVATVFRMVAEALRTLHQSTIRLQAEEELTAARYRLQAARERAVAALAQTGPQRLKRVQQLFDAAIKRAAGLQPYQPVPIHGAFGWHCVVSDGTRFYLYQFDTCRRSHPGFDIGGFLADLLRFYGLRKKRNLNVYAAGGKVFLETYFAGNPPSWSTDVPFFITHAMLLHLDRLLRRSQEKWQPKIEAFLEACTQVLQLAHE